ncbi:MAG: 3-phosphoglycerate dehydrogenase family protein [Saccharofermentanales bacterium]|jgi:D-3-phosphoglycerate dehydrogenase|nr:3-phosphoglycerate dehydrogenase family protein [Bacillota bacterium]NLN51961.1 3-phosphoglycerate dehydrogenase [Clostridiaceae bacterium]
MKEYVIKPINNIDQDALDTIPECFVVDPAAENPDAILVRSRDMHEMDFSSNLKFIGRAGSGVNNIPLEKCSGEGIVVCNAPGANANGVKELVALAMIMASRNVAEALKWTEDLRPDQEIKTLVETGKKEFVGPELYGKTVGVIGLGEIGALVANMCVDFGMEVYGYDPFLTVKHAWDLNSRIKRSNNLKLLFQQCDFITLHIPFNEDTRNFVNAKLLKNAKPGLCLVNMARGGLVDTNALKQAIDQNIISHYVCDFPDEETLTMERTINIPHLGASTPESEYNAAKMVIDQMVDYLKNGNIHNSVNFPNFDFGVCNGYSRITVLHKNIPNMIGQITNILANKEINISRLSNRHKENWAYTMIDIDDKIKKDTVQAIYDIDGVVRIRKLNGNK